MQRTCRPRWTGWAQATMVATWLTELYLDQINRALLEASHTPGPPAAAAPSPAAPGPPPTGNRIGSKPPATKIGMSAAQPTVAELERQLQVSSHPSIARSVIPERLSASGCGLPAVRLVSIRHVVSVFSERRCKFPLKVFAEEMLRLFCGGCVSFSAQQRK